MKEVLLSATGQDAKTVAIKATREAGAILKQHFYRKRTIETKGNRNLVTEVDLLSEKCILKILQEEFPGHSILCEESGKHDTESQYRWIIDPLDGTTNYAFGIGHFCVSIALMEGDDILLGILYDPLREELFEAQAGQGAYLNGSPISVASLRDLNTIIIGFDLGYSDTASKEMLSRANALWNPNITFRLMGSGALGIGYVACGRIDLYFHRSLYPWDTAAAILLVREAGGEVIDLEGCPATIQSPEIITCGDFNAYQSLVSALK